MNILLCSTPLQKTLGIVLQITEREREKKWESKRKKPENYREYSNKRIEMKIDYINLKRVSCFKQTV